MSADFRLATTDHWPLTTGHWPLAPGARQPSTVNRQPSTVNRESTLNSAAAPGYSRAMKSALLIVAAVVVVLAAVAGAIVFFTFAGRQPIADVYACGRVRVIKDGFVSFGVVDAGPGAVALIDAGHDRAGAAVLAELTRRRLGPGAVKAVLLTHGHPDHIAAIPLFPNAEVMVLPPDAALAEGRARGRGWLARLAPLRPTGVKVTRELHDGETIAIGDAFVRVFAIPGHTAGSAAYLVDGVLFLGDAADANDHGRVVSPPWLFSESLAQNRASLAHLAATLAKEGEPVNVLVFAHSGVLRKGPAPLAALGG